jgi:hypothetical protein
MYKITKSLSISFPICGSVSLTNNFQAQQMLLSDLHSYHGSVKKKSSVVCHWQIFPALVVAQPVG